MIIQDAALKAGPGGKIMCDGFEMVLTVPAFKGGQFLLADGTDWEPRIDQISSTGWQVIEPEKIEVGDTVAWREGGTSRQLSCGIVVSVTSEQVCWVDKDGFHYSLHASHLTLIQKGPKKHVFEGVKKVDCFYGPQGYTHIAIEEPTVEISCKKTYRMTLEEMPKVDTERGWHDG